MTDYHNKLGDTIREAGGAWPPPGARKVERAIARKPPTKDYEQLVRMELQLRKLRTAITNGRSRNREALRKQYFELKQRYDAHYTEDRDA